LDGENGETVMYNIRNVVYGSRIIIQHPYVLQIGVQTLKRNITNLIDYNLSDGISFAPKGVTFRISGVCNLNCQMCIYKNTDYLSSTKMLPWDIFTQVIDSVKNKHLIIIFTGGEPLLHPKIIDCIKYVKSSGLNCSLVTNGWLLERFAQDISSSGLNLLAVSVDGTEKIHDKIRDKQGSFQKAIAGINILNSNKQRPLLFINTSIQADNYAIFDELVDIAIESEVDGMNIQILWTRSPEVVEQHNQKHPEFSIREGWINEEITKIDSKVLRNTFSRIKKKPLLVNLFPSFTVDQIKCWYTNPSLLVKGHRSKCPWMMANVFHDGTMRMCDDIIIGDLHQSSFWDIWNSERMKLFRKILKDDQHFPICAGCCNLFRNNIL
jgi:MoaA/NifB/PqqE/SkfB family radical SAM enzyme